jgi:hypothetical protein
MNTHAIRRRRYYYNNKSKMDYIAQGTLEECKSLIAQWSKKQYCLAHNECCAPDYKIVTLRSLGQSAWWEASQSEEAKFWLN